MKPAKFFLALGAAVMLAFNDHSALAQDNWFWQNPLPNGNALKDIHVFDQNRAIAVGDLGAVMKSTDGGMSWSAQNNAGGAFILNSVSFFNANAGWAVGRDDVFRGYLLKTTNGGASWVTQKIAQPGSEDFFSVHFIDAKTGWAVGYDTHSFSGSFGIVYKTTDGGSTWSKLPEIGPANLFLYFVYFNDDSTGWAAGSNGTILKTRNGARTWSKQISGTTNHLYSASFVDTTTGWAVGTSGTILKTSDGGATWSPQNSGTTNTLRSVLFIDANTGWAAGDNGAILKTTNGGAQWLSQASGTTAALSSVDFIDDNTGWAVGSPGAILKTSNGGNTWVTQTPSRLFTTNRINSVVFVDANTGWAAGERGTILKTTDGGSAWPAQNSRTANSLQAISFANADFGWAVGSGGAILKTTDGGNTWTARASGTTSTLNAIYFSGFNTGWAAGSSGTILKSTNGGDSWVRLTSGTTWDLYSLYFLDDKTGWAVGRLGTILKTSDGGKTWLAQTSGTTQQLRSVCFLDANTGWVVGDAAVVLKTTDGGTVWVTENIGAPTSLNSVHVVAQGTSFFGWMVGLSGTIFKLANDGNTWSAQGRVTINDLNSVYLVLQRGNLAAWAVGANGTILKTKIDGAVTPPAEIKPAVATPQTIGEEFFVEVAVSDVQNLFGAGFELNYTNAAYVDYVAATPGDLLGNDVVFLSTPQDSAGKVSIGISRKAGQGGINGSGVVARIKLKSLATTPARTPVVFWLGNARANDPAGNAVPLAPLPFSATMVLESVVWPGDTNNDGVVNQADVLPIGLYWNKTGPPRQNGSCNWVRQVAAPWSPIAATYADANGEGVVNQADVLCIGLNWAKTHGAAAGAIAKMIAAKTLNHANAAGLCYSVTGDTTAGQEFWVEVSAASVTNLFGISFEVLYSPNAYLDPQTTEAGSFLGNDVIFFPNVDKIAGKISIGISQKAPQTGVSGS
ncbi:MAG: YCF48-related protein, partial [bacterium]